MNLRDVIKATLSRPVAFQPILAKICGSATAGLMLSQALYWSERTNDQEGWFFKSQAEWEEEICLTRWEQETARKVLRQKGLLQDVRRGNPARLYYRVNQETVARAIAEHASARGNMPTNSQIAEKPQSSLRDSRERKADRLDRGKAANKHAENPQSLIGTENTAETTSDIFGSAVAPPAAACPRKSKGREPDSRFQPVVEVIHKCWPEGVRWDFGSDDGRQLNAMLSRRQQWTAEELADCIVFRFLSENINPAEAVRHWIGAITEYANGPLDKYGQPRGRDLDHWRKRARTILDGPQPQQQKLPESKGDPLPSELDANAGNEAWLQILSSLKEQINPHSFDTWLKPTRPVGMKGAVLWVKVPNEDFKHIGDKYGQLIQEAIEALGLPITDVQIVCPAER